MSNLGYISIVFDDKTKKHFRELTDSLCNLDDYYYSDVVSYIKGNVTDKLHLTLFYGLIEGELDKSKLEEEISKVNKNLTYLKATKIALKS